jgi:hypothetical protein
MGGLSGSEGVRLCYPPEGDFFWLSVAFCEHLYADLLSAAACSNGEMSRFRHNSAGGVFFQQGASSRAVASAVGNWHGHLEREAAGVFS